MVLIKVLRSQVGLGLFRTYGNMIIILLLKNVKRDYLDFYIGPVKRVTKDNVSIHNDDLIGKLDDKATPINLSTIKTIKFGDRYSTTFSKYLKPKQTFKK